MEENVFTLKKAGSIRYSAVIIIDSDKADDIALLANTNTHAKSLLYILDQAAGDISLYENVYKSEYMCFNQGDSPTLNGGFLK